MSEQNAAAENKYVLLRPIVFEENEIKELIIDFESLDGDDLIAADRAAVVTFQGSYVPGAFRQGNPIFQACVVARAANVHVDVIRKLKVQDFTELTLRAQNFLLGMG